MFVSTFTCTRTEEATEEMLSPAVQVEKPSLHNANLPQRFFEMSLSANVEMINEYKSVKRIFLGT